MSKKSRRWSGDSDKSHPSIIWLGARGSPPTAHIIPTNSNWWKYWVAVRLGILFEAIIVLAKLWISSRQQMGRRRLIIWRGLARRGFFFFFGWALGLGSESRVADSRGRLWSVTAFFASLAHCTRRSVPSRRLCLAHYLLVSVRRLASSLAMTTSLREQNNSGTSTRKKTLVIIRGLCPLLKSLGLQSCFATPRLAEWTTQISTCCY
jgi:hypothetical protein